MRVTKYWAKRLEIFGPDKAFLPVTQDGLFQGNKDGMELGLVTLLPGVKDPNGRGVMLMDPSKQDASRFQRVQMVQSLWYVVHAVLENEDTQKKGVICLACPRNAKFSQVRGGRALCFNAIITRFADFLVYL